MSTLKDMNYSYPCTLTVKRLQDLGHGLLIEHLGHWFQKRMSSNSENWENHWSDQYSLIKHSYGTLPQGSTDRNGTDFFSPNRVARPGFNSPWIPTLHQRKYFGYCSSWWMKKLHLKIHQHEWFPFLDQHSLIQVLTSSSEMAGRTHVRHVCHFRGGEICIFSDLDLYEY